MKSLLEIRREHIIEVLERTDWDTRKASQILKISETLLKKEIHKFATIGNNKPKKR